MSILPMKKCKQCNHIFVNKNFGPKACCPRCGSKALTTPSEKDMALITKSQRKNK